MNQYCKHGNNATSKYFVLLKHNQFVKLLYDDFSSDEFSTIYTVDPLKSSTSFIIPVPSPPSLYPDNQGILVFTHNY